MLQPLLLEGSIFSYQGTQQLPHTVGYFPFSINTSVANIHLFGEHDSFNILLKTPKICSGTACATALKNIGVMLFTSVAFFPFQFRHCCLQFLYSKWKYLFRGAPSFSPNCFTDCRKEALSSRHPPPLVYLSSSYSFNLYVCIPTQSRLTPFVKQKNLNSF